MIREINLYAKNSKGKIIHPLEKLILIAIALVFNGYTKNINFLILNIILFSFLSYRLRNPIKIVFKFMCIAILFFVMSSITLIFTYSIHEISIIFLRVLSGSIIISYLSLTTPLDDIIYVFYKIPIFKDLSDIAKSMERFLILIEDDFQITYKAIKSRGGFNGFKRGISDFGTMCGVVLKNLFHKWRDIDLGLNNRCYTGNISYIGIDFNLSKIRIGLIAIYFILSIIVISI
ncbi:CbiQ family ECF transporter T component [Clostridium frigidicarnis]|uniref:Cobalt/nickel transport system permease protein n=1 Tax=Clostridium frigidicarnis TaxID=84698 RepID=A0A1I0XYE5_9CLOT|nr:CbiQ family ECF transporter T component [Clostridium frigidicarnis]SFB05934.1 cobalt/nickel transport system permease protein [Clostridium frigidicarnis]